MVHRSYPSPGKLAGAVLFLMSASWSNAVFAQALVIHSAEGQELFANSARLTVEQLVESVLARNPDLPAMQAAWQAAQSRIEQVSALADPMLSYVIAPQTVDSERFDLGQKIMLSQRLPWPGKLRLRGDAARYESEAAQANVETTRLKLIATAKSAFANWYYSHQAISINKENQQLWKGFVSIAKLRYANGSASQQNALRAEVEQHKLELQGIVLERKKLDTRSTLNALLNRNPDQPIPPPAPLNNPAIIPSVEQLHAWSLETRPELQALAARIKAAKTRINLAEKNFYPDFKISAGYNSLWGPTEKRGTIGIGINIPFNQDKRRARLGEAQAKLKRIEFKLAVKTAKVKEQVQRAFDRVVESRQSLALYRKYLLPLTRENIDAASADYHSGAGDFLSLVSVEKNLLTTKLRTQRTLSDYHSRLAELERVVGKRFDHSSDNELSELSQ